MQLQEYDDNEDFETRSPSSLTAMHKNNSNHPSDPHNNNNGETRKREKRTWRETIVYILNIALTVMLSQLISLLLCMTGVFSQSLTQFHNISTPTVQNSISYFTLTIFYMPLFLIQKLKLKKSWNSPWYIYPIIALCDAIANYLVVKAYNYTSITSIQLLDCLSIPNVLILSFVFLRRKYGWMHLSGVVLCVAGVVVVIASEARINKGDGSHHISFDKRALIGDLLCISGSVFYAISNVAQEAVLSRHQASNGNSDTVIDEEHVNHLNDDSSDVLPHLNAHHTSDSVNEESPLSPQDSMELNSSSEDPPNNVPAIYIEESLSTHSHKRVPSRSAAIIHLVDNTVEYLSMVGLFGTLYSIILMLVIERQEIVTYTHKLPVNVYLYLGGFSLSMLGIYSLVPVLLFRASATFMNLSFLSSDLWAMIVSLLVFGGRGVTWMWGIAAILVISGVIIYHVRGDSYREAPKSTVSALAQQQPTSSPKDIEPVIDQCTSDHENITP